MMDRHFTEVTVNAAAAHLTTADTHRRQGDQTFNIVSSQLDYANALLCGTSVRTN